MTVASVPSIPSIFYEFSFNADPNQAAIPPLWSDLSTRVTNGWTLTRGRQYELDTDEAGTWEVELDNPDGALDPSNTSSPYAPILLYRPARIRVVLGNNLLAPDAAAAGEYAQLNPGPVPAWVGVGAFGVSLATIAAVGVLAYQGARVWSTTVPSGMAGADLLDVSVPQVTAGQVYTFSTQAQAITSGQNPSTAAAVNWIGTAGQTLSTTTGSPTVLTGAAGTWTQLSVTGQAPAGAVAAMLRVVTTTTPTANSTVWTDALQLEARGYATRWQMPWTPGTNMLPQNIATGSETMAVGDAVTNWWTPIAGTITQATNLTAAPTGGTTAVAWALPAGSTTSYALYAGVAAAGGTGPVADNVQVTAGSTYTASVYLSRTGPDATVTVTAKIAWFTSSGSLLSTTTGAAATVPTSGWVRATASGTAPAGAAWGRMYVAVASPGTFTGTETIYGTGWQMEQAAAASVWADPGAPCFLFTGLVERFPGTYDALDGTYGTSKLECVDVTAALSQFPLLAPFVQEVLALAPNFFYQLDEPLGSTACADTAGRRIPAPVENGPYGAGSIVFGNSVASTNTGSAFVGSPGPVATFNNNPNTGFNPQYAESFVSLHKTTATPGPPATSDWTRAIAFRSPTITGTLTAYTLWGAFPPTWNGVNNSDFVLAIAGSGGALSLGVRDAVGGVVNYSGVSNVCDGNWHQLFVTYVKSTQLVTYYVDGVQVGNGNLTQAPSGFVSDVLGCQVQLGAGIYEQGHVGDLAHAFEIPAALTPAQVTNLYNSWRTASSGESTGARYARILRWIGWTGPTSIASGSTQSMGPATDTDGQVPLDALNGTAVTENGESYVSAAGWLTFTARSALYGVRTPVVTFGEGRPVGNAGEWPCEVGSIDFDPSHLANVVQVTQYNGPIYTASDAASIRRHYSRLFQRTVNVSAGSEAQDAASYLLSQLKDPHQRADAIRLHPAAVVGLFPVLARLDKNARIRYVKRPVGSPARTLDGFIQRIVWSWTADINDCTVEYQASPADLVAYWRIGALHTTLNAQASSGQANATINALPDAARNKLAQSMPSAQVLWFEPGTPRFEAVTVKTIPSTVLGYTTATLVMTSNFAFTHAANSVVCEPLQTGVTDPTTWDVSSVLGASYAPILSGGTAGTNTVTVGPLPDAAYNALGQTWNTGDVVVLSSGGVGTAETATIQSVATTYPGYTSAVITFTANLVNNHPVGDYVSDQFLVANTAPATFAPTTRVTY